MFQHEKPDEILEAAGLPYQVKQHRKKTEDLKIAPPAVMAIYQL